MNPIDKLLVVLDKNVKLYEELTDCSEKEREALENGELKNLEKVTAAKESITFNLKRLEERRKALLAEISADLGLSHTPITLKALAERPECRKLREKIMKVRKRLTRAALYATDLNSFNRQLIGKAVSVMKKSLLYALPPKENATTYSNGKMDEVPTASGSVLRETF